MTKSKISKLKETDKTWLRDDYDQDAIERYKEKYKASNEKPIILQKGTNKIIDGYHRLKALKELDKDFVKAEFRDISDSELRKESSKINNKHGIPLSKKERNEQIVKLYKKDHLTQKEIAGIFGIDRSLVSKIVKNSHTNNSEEPEDSEEVDETEIISHLLGGNTQEETAELYNKSQGRVAQIWKDFKEKVNDKYSSGIPVELIPQSLDTNIEEEKVKSILKENENFIDIPQLIEGNSIKKLKKFPDNTFDLILTDPPYFLEKHDYDTEWEDLDEFLDWTKEWLKLAIPKLNDEGRLLVFWSQEHIHRFPEVMESIDHNLEFGNICSWIYRNNKKPNDQRKFKKTWEPIFHYHKEESPTLGNGAWGDKRLDTFIHAVPQSQYEDEKLHPAQKPLECIRELVSVTTEEGGLVLDPFGGAGTTGVGCMRENRIPFLIEKEPKYMEIVKERMKNEI